MGLQMAWGWEADGLAADEFATVEDAITSLAASVRWATARYGSEEQSRMLRLCVEPVQARMRTEGVQALAEGREWRGECGGLFVRLTPQP